MKLLKFTGNESTQIITEVDDSSTIHNPIGCFVVFPIIFFMIFGQGLYVTLRSVIQFLSGYFFKNANRYGIVNAGDRTIIYKFL